jgi:hypothetical protein
MAITFLWPAKTNLVISNVAGTIYTNPAATKTFIPNILLHNTHTVAVTVTLYCVPNSAGAVGTAGTGNQFFKESIAADESYPINDHSFTLDGTNDTLQAVASVDAKVTIFLSGFTQT